MGESAEDLLAVDPVLGEVHRIRRPGASLGWGELTEGTVRPGSVVVRLYRFRTRHRSRDLRFGRMLRGGQDRSLCLLASST